MTKAEPERFSDTKRNLILNRTVDNIHQSIHNHDPDINRPIDQEVWDCLDQMALEIEAQAHAAGVREGVEKAAKVVQNRFEARLQDQTTQEPDTGEVNMSDETAAQLEELEEVENEIRALIKE